MDEKLLASREEYTEDVLAPLYHYVSNELRGEESVYCVDPTSEHQKLLHLHALNKLMGGHSIPEALVLPRDTNDSTDAHQHKQEAYIHAAKILLAGRLKVLYDPKKVESSEYTPSSPEEIAIKLSVGQAEKSLHGEDTILRDDNQRLYGIFDGMGGVERMNPDGSTVKVAHLASNAAAGAVAERYAEFTNNPDTLDEALLRAQYAMASARQAVRDEAEGGGTTAVFCKFESIRDRKYLVWANAGDSRLFIQTGVNATIQAVSTDQSRGSDVQNGLAEEMRGWPEVSDEYGFRQVDVDDRVMLCSDGITGDKPEQFLTDEEMQRAFSMQYPNEAAEALVDMSKKYDDKSVLVIDVHSTNSDDQGMPSLDPEETPIGIAYQTYDKNSNRYRDRLKDRMRKAQAALAPSSIAALATSRLFASNPYRSRAERNRRKKALALVAGVAAVGFTYLAAQKLGIFDHHRVIPGVKKPSLSIDLPSLKPEGPKHPPQSPQLHEHLAQSRHRTLQPRGNIWNSVKSYLHDHDYATTKANIDSVSDSVRAKYGISELAARHLPVGFHFTIPLHALKELKEY